MQTGHKGKRAVGMKHLGAAPINNKNTAVGMECHGRWMMKLAVTMAQATKAEILRTVNKHMDAVPIIIGDSNAPVNADVYTIKKPHRAKHPLTGHNNAPVGANVHSTIPIHSVESKRAVGMKHLDAVIARFSNNDAPVGANSNIMNAMELALTIPQPPKRKVERSRRRAGRMHGRQPHHGRNGDSHNDNGDQQYGAQWRTVLICGYKHGGRRGARPACRARGRKP